MNILIVSANTLPMSPVGAAGIAGAALAAGHRVTVFDCLPDQGDDTRFLACLEQFEPDVVGLSIPLVTCSIAENPLPNGFSFTDIRPMLKRLVALVRQHTNALVVAGGSGFNYFPADWLFCLDIEYGLVGECETSFPLFLDACPREKALRRVPGIVIRSGEKIWSRPWQEVAVLDDTALPAWHLFDADLYNRMDVPWGIFTKRGCAFGCTWCSASFSQGRDYRIKSPDRILAEIHHIRTHTGSSAVTFCDTSFNCPIPHVKALCHTLIDTKTPVQWRSGTFKPLGISREFCRLIRSAGCTFAGLSLDTAAARLLANMNRDTGKTISATPWTIWRNRASDTAYPWSSAGPAKPWPPSGKPLRWWMTIRTSRRCGSTSGCSGSGATCRSGCLNRKSPRKRPVPGCLVYLSGAGPGGDGRLY
jgi:anaerobic magnesium-protoporphyrin IX monomethyl ester cyclase